MLHSWVPTETALGSWLWENGFAFKFSKSLYPGKYLNIEEGLPQYMDPIIIYLYIALGDNLFFT